MQSGSSRWADKLRAPVSSHIPKGSVEEMSGGLFARFCVSQHDVPHLINSLKHGTRCTCFSSRSGARSVGLALGYRRG